MIDFLPTIVAEVAADAAVIAIAGERVRNHFPAPGDATAGPPYQPFVTLIDLGHARDPRTTRNLQRVLARCYGQTPRQAFDLYAAVHDVLHLAGPRTGADGAQIHGSREDVYEGQSDDPDTRQPVAEAIFIVVGATIAAP